MNDSDSRTAGRAFHISSTFPPFEKTHSTLERDKTQAYWKSTAERNSMSPSSPAVLYGKALPPVEQTGGNSAKKMPGRSCGVKYLITSTFPPFEHTRSGGVFQDLLDSMHSKDFEATTEPTYFSSTPYSSTTGIDYSLKKKQIPQEGEPDGYKELPLDYYFHTTGARSMPTFDKSFYFQKKHPHRSILTSQFPPFESSKYFSDPPPELKGDEPVDFQLFDVTGARDMPYPPKLKSAPARVHAVHEATALQPMEVKLDFTTRPLSPDTRRSLSSTVNDIRAGGTRERLGQTLYTSVKPEDFLIGTSKRYHGTFKYPQ